MISLISREHSIDAFCAHAIAQDFYREAHPDVEIASNAQSAHAEIVFAFGVKLSRDGVGVRLLEFHKDATSISEQTWKYFFPQQAPPLLVSYISDRELCKYENASSAEICEFLYAVLSTEITEENFARWREVLRADENAFQKMIPVGAALMMAKRNRAQRMMRHVRVKRFSMHGGEIDIPMLNADISPRTLAFDSALTWHLAGSEIQVRIFAKYISPHEIAARLFPRSRSEISRDSQCVKVSASISEMQKLLQKTQSRSWESYFFGALFISAIGCAIYSTLGVAQRGTLFSPLALAISVAVAL